MTKEQALVVKGLAKDTVDVLGAITERECPECRGNRQIDYTPTCKKCNGIGRIGWNWEPKDGIYCIINDEVHLLFPTGYGDLSLGYNAGVSCGRSTDYADEYYYREFTNDTKKYAIPILEWEEIERVLEGVGYHSYFERHPVPNILEYLPWFYEIRIPTKHECYDITRGEGKSRQEAVMRAVIKLGKEVR